MAITLDGTTGITTPGLTNSGSQTVSAGTANGVTYLNGSKVLTSGSALTFDGTNFASTGNITSGGVLQALTTVQSSSGADLSLNANGANRDVIYKVNATELMRLVGSTGNLGIGTSSPNAKIEAYSATAGAEVSRFEGNYSAGGTVALATFRRLGGAVASAVRYNDTTGAIEFGTTTNHAQTFITNSTERMRLDSAGNLLLGVTSSTGLTGTGDFAMPNNRAIRFRNAANSAYLNMIYVDTSNNLNFGYGGVPPTITFGINGVGEVSRFDSSGNFLVGKTSASTTTVGAELQPTASAGYIASFTSDAQRAVIANRLTSDGELYSMRRSGTVVGTISVTTTATAYNTSSDYRLKNTIAPMSGALAKVAQLKPCTYKWNADGSDGEGFIAHELADVVPQCVTGGKDAVDEEGNPKYQGIDTSFLVATLTAALQELNAKFEAYVASHP